MPVSRRQCTKYMQLAEHKPEFLVSNGYSSSHLDINSEIRLLTVDDEVENQVRETVPHTFRRPKYATGHKSTKIAG